MAMRVTRWCEDGRVIGLLTRRAVDRAISHKLNLTAASLMEAGEVTVQPQDSLDHLQRLMTATGWGQVPVVDPASGQADRDRDPHRPVEDAGRR